MWGGGMSSEEIKDNRVAGDEGNEREGGREEDG